MKIALLGAGAIARTICQKIEKRIEIVSVVDIDKESASKLAEEFSIPHFSTEINDILSDPSIELVVEAASQKAVLDNVLNIINAGKNILIMSISAFAFEGLYEDVINAANKNNCKVYMPSGGIVGIDGLKSVRHLAYNVELITTKNPKSLAGSKSMSGTPVEETTGRCTVFYGTAREAAKAFPKNINVCALLSIAGIGFDKTMVRIVADPSVERNCHEIIVEGSFGKMSTKTENVPDVNNPKTSYIASLSAVALINGLNKHVRLGN